MFNKRQVDYITQLITEHRRKRYDIVKIIRSIKEMTWKEARRECWLIKYEKGQYSTPTHH